MTTEQLEQLQKEVNELEFTLNHIIFENQTQGDSIFLRVKTVKTYSLLCSRFFGSGSHERSVEIPKMVYSNIRTILKTILAEKRDKLENALKMLATL